MRVAVAGTGNLAHYLFEELRNHGHELVVLTRKTKSGQNFEQRETEYDVASLVSVLHDCDALVSTIADFGNPSVATKIQFAMIDACQQSSRCKTFIPSEWTCDTETYPDQPYLLAESNRVLHDKLASAKGLRTTIICNSWFANYVLPASNRYIRDIGPFWPMDHANKIFTIYGPGTQVLDFTGVRDIARAVAILLDSKETWEPFTFISGDQLSWNELYAIMKRRDPAWATTNQSLGSSLDLILKNESIEKFIQGHFELLIYSGASKLPNDKVQAHRTKYFPTLHFLSIEELLDAAHGKPNVIV